MIWLGYYIAIGVAVQMLSFAVLRLTGKDTGTINAKGTFLGILIWPIPVAVLLSMVSTAIFLMVIVHMHRIVGGKQ